jgi:hypothetical protein
MTITLCIQDDKTLTKAWEKTLHVCNIKGINTTWM